jgi:hypothetical protein
MELRINGKRSMKTSKKDKQTMNCLCTSVSKGEELAWGVMEGETLPERPG